MFEQAVGFGFGSIEPREAIARFGDFPYWIYAYSGASSIANVLFSEPTAGVFSTIRNLTRGQAQASEVINLASSIALTTVIGWWALACIKTTRGGREWSLESRLAVALPVALLGCGALSFNYSRSRLGGMAVVFYALAAFFALRLAAVRALDAPRARFVVTGVVLALIVGAWQTRAVATLEHLRLIAEGNQAQWVLILPSRQVDFADRPAYQDVLRLLTPQGSAPSATRPTAYPPWLAHTLGLP